MSNNPGKSLRKKRIGRPPKSGAFSPICRQEFLEEYPEIRRYIQGARDGLVDDQCRRFGVKSEEELPAAVRLSIDRQVSKLSLSRQIEVYIMRHGLLRRDRLKGRSILEAEPIALFWLNLQNSLDRGLMSLAVEPPKETEPALMPLELAQVIDREKAEREAAGEGGQRSAPDSSETGRKACPGANGEAIDAKDGREEASGLCPGCKTQAVVSDGPCPKCGRIPGFPETDPDFPGSRQGEL